MPSGTNSLSEAPTMPNVSSKRLVDLMESNDPDLVRAVEALIMVMSRRPEVRQGWSSAPIDVL